MKGSFDSNILIDILNGVAAAAELWERYTERCISIVVWIELMAGIRVAGAELETVALLRTFQVVQLSDPIADETVRIRQERRLKLPDAIILATARHLGCPLLTRNTRDFDASDPGIVIPYRL